MTSSLARTQTEKFWAITKKSLTICFGESHENLAPIYLNGDPLRWKEKVKHIGTVLQKSRLLDQDIQVIRGNFIHKCMNLNQEFQFSKIDT